MQSPFITSSAAHLPLTQIHPAFRVESFDRVTCNCIKRHNKDLNDHRCHVSLQDRGNCVREAVHSQHSCCISPRLLLYAAVGKGAWGPWRDLAAPSYHLIRAQPRETASGSIRGAQGSEDDYNMQGADNISHAIYCKAQWHQFFININTMISLGRQEIAFDFFR